ncbi:MAG: hypothetical protein JW940_00300 [Polyangiaceae bacterium]|nr:hypothetical protein [Polyangiaceae bacterium]
MTIRLMTGRSPISLGARGALVALAFAAPSVAAEPASAPDADAPASPPASAEPAASSASAGSPTAPAAAEPAATAEVMPAAQPRIQIPVAELPPPVARTLRVHDGLYLRLNGGIGFVKARTSGGSDGSGDLQLRGSDMALDLLVGGSPSPGVTLGGGMFMNLLLAADAEPDDRRGTRDVGILVIGPFIDGFPRPKKGWHLGGSLGLAVASIEDIGPSGDTRRTGGFGALAWGGYDAWIGDDWCVGGLMRLGMTRTSDRDHDAKLTATSRSLTLMFTALYQ